MIKSPGTYLPCSGMARRSNSMASRLSPLRKNSPDTERPVAGNGVYRQKPGQTPHGIPGLVPIRGEIGWRPVDFRILLYIEDDRETAGLARRVRFLLYGWLIKR